jgi:hypothetical protein
MSEPIVVDLSWVFNSCIHMRMHRFGFLIPNPSRRASKRPTRSCTACTLRAAPRSTRCPRPPNRCDARAIATWAPRTVRPPAWWAPARAASAPWRAVSALARGWRSDSCSARPTREHAHHCILFICATLSISLMCCNRDYLCFVHWASSLKLKFCSCKETGHQRLSFGCVADGFPHVEIHRNSFETHIDARQERNTNH